MLESFVATLNNREFLRLRLRLRDAIDTIEAADTTVEAEAASVSSASKIKVKTNQRWWAKADACHRHSTRQEWWLSGVCASAC